MFVLNFKTNLAVRQILKDDQNHRLKKIFNYS
jgi:hypothetical protein